MNWRICCERSPAAAQEAGPDRRRGVLSRGVHCRKSGSREARPRGVQEAVVNCGAAGAALLGGLSSAIVLQDPEEVGELIAVHVVEQEDLGHLLLHPRGDGAIQRAPLEVGVVLGVWADDLGDLVAPDSRNAAWVVTGDDASLLQGEVAAAIARNPRRPALATRMPRMAPQYEIRGRTRVGLDLCVV